jgi:Na+-driven multidrug efflux pump
MRLSLSKFRLDPGVIWRIIKIGAPAMVSGMQRTCGQFILLTFISPFGTIALAAHTVAQRVEMFIMMPSMAFGQSAGVLAGQNLGAGKPERAEKSAWFALALVEGIAMLFSIAVLVWPEFVVRIFNTEPKLVYTASIFLRIAVAGYVVIGLALSLMHMLTGAGDTVPPMIISVAIGWGVQLPLAYFLPKVGNLGVYGVRWAIVSEFVFGAIAYLIYFRTGRWKRKKV